MYIRFKKRRRAKRLHLRCYLTKNYRTGAAVSHRILAYLGGVGEDAIKAVRSDDRRIRLDAAQRLEKFWSRVQAAFEHTSTGDPRDSCGRASVRRLECGSRLSMLTCGGTSRRGDNRRHRGMLPRGNLTHVQLEYSAHKALHTGVTSSVVREPFGLRLMVSDFAGIDYHAQFELVQAVYQSFSSGNDWPTYIRIVDAGNNRELGKYTPEAGLRLATRTSLD